jgi:DNA-binding transcriptional LysR family regulator
MDQPMPEDAVHQLVTALAPRLALLRALAQDGNLTRAAQRLGIPQPTATRWIAALSRELTVPVAARHGRGIVLTRAGEHLADAADRALAEVESGCRRALEEADPARGTVSLGFLHTMGGVRVPELLRAFLADFPAVRFTLAQGGHEGLLRLVRGGAIDLALTAPLPDGDDELAAAPLSEQPLMAIVHSGHRLAGRRRVALRELAGERFIGLKSGYGVRQITDELCAAAGFTPMLAFEGEEADTVRGLVAAGLGVALLPIAEPAPPTGTVELPLSPRAHRTIGLVWATQRPLAPAARSFRDFAVRQKKGTT